MDASALLAGPAIEGRTKIGEDGIFESPMCDIPAGSCGLSAASENAIVVSPFPPRIIVSLRKRGEPTVVRAARAKEKFSVVTTWFSFKGAETNFAIETRGPGNLAVRGLVRF